MSGAVMEPSRLRICARCGAMVAWLKHQPARPCDCGGRVFHPPALAPWKPSAQDRRMLRSFRIQA